MTGMRSNKTYTLLGKRLIDVIITSIVIILFSPLILLIVTCVQVFIGKPILFKQLRPGIKCNPFYIYKFRSMNENKDSSGNLLPDAERLSRFGRFLRSTSLDELPELINVLKGEMSLVGPRPLLMQYVERYSPEQKRRQEVLPGITGWAQINGRNAITWKDKFILDVWYVDNMSVWLDLKILFITLWKVLKREGISQPGHATAGEFMGNDE